MLFNQCVQQKNQVDASIKSQSPPKSVLCVNGRPEEKFPALVVELCWCVGLVTGRNYTSG